VLSLNYMGAVSPVGLNFVNCPCHHVNAAFLHRRNFSMGSDRILNKRTELAFVYAMGNIPVAFFSRTGCRKP